MRYIPSSLFPLSSSLLFDSNNGLVLKIKKIIIEGNRKISDKFEELKNIIEVKRSGMRGEKPLALIFLDC
jgi:outer membrane protein assembly factor BamA